MSDRGNLATSLQVIKMRLHGHAVYVVRGHFYAWECRYYQGRCGLFYAHWDRGHFVCLTGLLVPCFPTPRKECSRSIQAIRWPSTLWASGCRHFRVARQPCKLVLNLFMHL